MLEDSTPSDPDKSDPAQLKKANPGKPNPQWDGYALEAVEAHAAALKAKCIEITHRCKLPSVTDYTVKMALRELRDEST
jgi:hypothetical protein